MKERIGILFVSNMNSALFICLSLGLFPKKFSDINPIVFDMPTQKRIAYWIGDAHCPWDIGVAHIFIENICIIEKN